MIAFHLAGAELAFHMSTTVLTHTQTKWCMHTHKHTPTQIWKSDWYEWWISGLQNPNWISSLIETHQSYLYATHNKAAK